MPKRTAEELAARAEKKAAKAARLEKKAAKAARKAEKEKATGTRRSPRLAPATHALPPPLADDARFATFTSTPFAAPIVSSLSSSYAAPTEIQSRAWPVALDAGRDLIAVAKTGSGKTLAFALPMLHHLAGAASRAVGGLVLSPTRELAVQIHVEAERFGKLVGVRTMAVYGGTPLHEQKAKLASQPPALVVATPGRLVDLLENGAISLAACATVTLDEADRLLDMGFKPQLDKILSSLPSPRQTLLFTATWPKAVRKLAAAYLRAEPTTLFLGGGDKDADGGADDACELSANVAVAQSFVQATDDEKDNKLWNILGELAEGSRVIVFANTKRRVENLARTFGEFGTCSVHGDKQQREREAALADFVANKRPLMVATDVAARGLDIKLVTHVINYDMARDVESYVHRIGRTGRAGAVGKSVTFWNPDYDKECAPALVRIARKAKQEVPDWLAKFEKSKANKQWNVEKADKELESLAADVVAAVK